MIQINFEHPACRAGTDFELQDQRDNTRKFLLTAKSFLHAMTSRNPETIAWTRLDRDRFRSVLMLPPPDHRATPNLESWYIVFIIDHN
jgi:hypothetical protein